MKKIIAIFILAVSLYSYETKASQDEISQRHTESLIAVAVGSAANLYFCGYQSIWKNPASILNMCFISIYGGAHMVDRKDLELAAATGFATTCIIEQLKKRYVQRQHNQAAMA